MQFWIDLLTSPTVLIAALVIGAFGEAVKKVISAFRKPVMYDEHGHVMSTLTINGQAVTYRDSKGQAVPPPDPLWMRIFDATLPAQPVLIGLLLGCIPWLPAEHSLIKEHYEFAGHLATYGAAGILCKVAYDILITTIRRFIATKANQVIHSLGTTAESISPTAVAITTGTDPSVATDPNPSTDSAPTDDTSTPPTA